ncbi:two-component system, cell cycle sensor histidine kinase PleC [Limimonas halophila]|uniref:histidine kinase n=1 Tax=Limimonas halophila TaxID=1082479 RepID=A0A1G7LRE4_9PROT|nr:ATP-binding protein [Limimonas halophila]SDF52118.1 two-component system, cell cycle sensor histidine kinase PleC [Limimonas halophila]
MLIGSIAHPLPAISSDMACSDVLALMHELDATAGLAVVEDGRPIGMAGRTALMRNLAHPVTYALYEHRPISLLMRGNPLVVESGTTIDRVNELIATEKQWALEEGFIVVEGGRYAGVGTIQALLKRSVSDARTQIAELDHARKQAERANEAKTTFLANLSHELRTPLNAIMGFTDMLAAGAAGPVNDKQAEYLRDIHGSGKRLLDLISDLLDLSRAEAGRMELDEGEVDVPAVVEEAARILQVRARDKQVTLTTQLRSRTRLWADEGKLLQIILNLGNNAIKFTPAGGRVALTVDDAADCGVVLHICDTGPGIPEHEIPRIKEPFGRGRTARRQKIEGAGIGLALTQTLTAMHGGHLDITSTPGEGTCVHVHMPGGRAVARVETEPPAARLAAE